VLIYWLLHYFKNPSQTLFCLPDDWKSANVIPLFKFEISSFTRYEAMNGGAKCRNGVVCGG